MPNFSGRKVHMPAFGGRKLNAQAMGGFEPDDDDDDASDLLDQIAGALGTDGRRLRVALLASVQSQMALSNDGKVVRFESAAATGTEVKEFILATSSSVAVQVMAADTGYFVGEIEVECDGLGSNDNATAILTISGHQPVPERFLVGGDGATIQWGRPLTQTTQFTIECPSAATGKEVGVLFAARGIVPDKEALNAHSKAYRAAAGGDEKKAFAKVRAKNNERADHHREKRKARDGQRNGQAFAGAGGRGNIASRLGPGSGLTARPNLRR